MDIHVGEQGRLVAAMPQVAGEHEECQGGRMEFGVIREPSHVLRHSWRGWCLFQEGSGPWGWQPRDKRGPQSLGDAPPST